MNNNVLTYAEYQKRLKELKTPEDVASFAQELIAPALAGNMTPKKKGAKPDEPKDEAPDEMKRLFLGLYWERFEVTDKKAVTVIPSPIIRALMQAERLVFTNKYKEGQVPRIVTDLEVGFTPVVDGKSKSKVAPKTQKSRHKAETFEVVSNKPSAVILDTVWGAYPDSNWN